mgnify:FL=1|jgi:hypothetical protein
MITQFMITEITKLISSAQKQNVKLSQEYVDALYELNIQDIIMLRNSYESEKIFS